MSGEVMDPSLDSQLGHDGIDEGIPRAAGLPGLQQSRVIVPGDLAALRVADHRAIVWDCHALSVVKLPPQHLQREIEKAKISVNSPENSDGMN